MSSAPTVDKSVNVPRDTPVYNGTFYFVLSSAPAVNVTPIVRHESGNTITYQPDGSATADDTLLVVVDDTNDDVGWSYELSVTQAE